MTEPLAPAPPGYATAPPIRRRFGTGRWLLVAVVVVSLVVVGVAAVSLGTSGLAGLTAPTLTVPGTATRHLSPGRYLVFEATGSEQGGAGFTFSENQPPVTTPEDVTVVGPDAARVPVAFTRSDQTLKRGGRVYTGVVEFHVERAGVYRITVQGAAHQVVISRSLFDGQASTIVTLVLAVLVAGIAGLALIIATIVHARHSRVPAPGGFPGPGQPPYGPHAASAPAPPPPVGPWNAPPPPPPPGPLGSAF